MNAHRIFCIPEPQRRRFTWRAVLAPIAVAAVLGAIILGVSRGAPAHGPAAPPLRTPDVLAFPVEPVDGQRLAQIRAEAFRAGLAEGLQQSCGVPVLDRPVAAR
jgi:hypothetical protein